MLEVIILLAAFILGFLIGEVSAMFKLSKVIVTIAENEGIISTDEEDENPELYKLFVENINDMLYLYNQEDKAFICQGKTIEELAKLSQELKNIKYAAVAHDNKVFGFVDGSVKNI
jgi:hypothetical protein